MAYLSQLFSNPISSSNISEPATLVQSTMREPGCATPRLFYGLSFSTSLQSHRQLRHPRNQRPWCKAPCANQAALRPDYSMAYLSQLLFNPITSSGIPGTSDPGAKHHARTRLRYAPTILWPIFLNSSLIPSPAPTSQNQRPWCKAPCANQDALRPDYSITNPSQLFSNPTASSNISEPATLVQSTSYNDRIFHGRTHSVSTGWNSPFQHPTHRSCQRPAFSTNFKINENVAPI